jgi:hypothetical protein
MPATPNYSSLPPHLQESFQLYIERRVPTGGFLTALLSNDLKETFARADNHNRHLVYDIVFWLYNEAPMPCWGSPENVQAWLHPKEQINAN